MTALSPQQKERQGQARARASKIRTGIVGYLETLAVIAEAWKQNDWDTLGYDSWAAYVESEFGADRLRIPAAHRQKAVNELRLTTDMSNRAIAQAVGVSPTQVRRDLTSGGTDVPPEAVRGADGKSYPPARSPVAEAMEQAIVDANERANGHRDAPSPGAGFSDPAGAEAATSAPARDHREPAPGEAASVGHPLAAAGAGVQPPAPEQDHRDERPGAPDESPANDESGRTDVESPSVDPEPAPPLVAGSGSPNVPSEPATCPACGQPLPT